MSSTSLQSGKTSYSDDELVVFVGYASDAEEHARAIKSLEPALQNMLTGRNETVLHNFRIARVYLWGTDATPRVGGQSHINPYIERADIGVFVFAGRMGTTTWDELRSCCQRKPKMHVLAIFPAAPPEDVDLTDDKIASAWANLMAKRRELCSDWSDVDSQSVFPQNAYSCVNDLEKIVWSR